MLDACQWAQGNTNSWCDGQAQAQWMLSSLGTERQNHTSFAHFQIEPAPKWVRGHG